MDRQRPARALPPLHLAPNFESGTASASGRDAAHGTHRGRRVACKHCRQSKLRCDGLANNSGPCDRCRRLQLECYVDLEYKRVSKRIKLNELEEQVQQLRQVVTQGGQLQNVTDVQQDVSARSSSQAPPPGLIQKETSTPHGLNVAQTKASQPYQSRSNQQESTEILTGMLAMRVPPEQLSPFSFQASSSRSLDHITLTPRQVKDLFQIFFKFYHPFLEILDPSLSPDACYTKSPALFWVIIGIASRTYGEDPNLVIGLSSCVPKVLWSCITVLPHRRDSIHAILLLSFWSFPTSSMSTDPSFILTSLAKSASMQLGLHRPEIVQDFLRVKTRFNKQEFQEAVKTWVGCYITAQNVTAAIGQSSLFSKDWVIDRACELGNQYTLPDNLRYNLLIYKFMTKVNMRMAEDERSQSGHPNHSESAVLMTLLEHDFIDLERQISDKLNETLQILLSMACVQLRTYYFFMASSSENRKQGLLKGYCAALDLISKASDADTKWDFARYAPNGHYSMLTMAAILLMKIINSSYSIYVDVEEGKSAFNKVLSLLEKASIKDDDLRGRSSKVLAQLWCVHQSAATKRNQEPDLNIKTRHGASVLHDSLWTWREEFGGQRSEPRSEASPKAAGSEPAVENPSGTQNTEQSNYAPGVTSYGDQETATDQIFFNDMYNFTGNLQDTGWVWDLGLPSLLPIDLDSYPAMLPSMPHAESQIE